MIPTTNKPARDATMTGMTLRVLSTALLLSLAPAMNAHAAPALDFRAGDRWTAVGDSITHTGSYAKWIELYYVTRFPTRPITVFNCGFSGETAKMALNRLSWDVAVHRPTVMTVMLGMNDVMRALYASERTESAAELATLKQNALADYRVHLLAVVKELQATGARVILITPSMFDQTAQLASQPLTGVNDALAECARIAGEIAASSGAGVIDFHAAMTRLNAAQQQKDPAFTLIGPDRIHPGPAGHFVMAYLFLKAQGATATVASLTLDASKRSAAATQNGDVSDLDVSPAQVAFSWQAHALPSPIDPDVQPALSWIPFTDELNRETLTVTGLDRGYYRLSIDGRMIRIYSAEQLAGGVNLATEAATPQYQQALQVLALLNERSALVIEELRSVAYFEHRMALPDTPADRPVTLEMMWPAFLQRSQEIRSQPTVPFIQRIVEYYPYRKAREKQTWARVAELDADIRRLAQPVSHCYALIRIKQR